MVLESSLQEAAQEKKKSPLRAATWGQLAPQPVSGAQGLQDLQLWTREQADFGDIFVKKHVGILLFSIFTITKMKITGTLQETVTSLYCLTFGWLLKEVFQHFKIKMVEEQFTHSWITPRSQSPISY